MKPSNRLNRETLAALLIVAASLPAIHSLAQAAAITVFTDKTMYYPGDSVVIYGVVTDASSNPVPDAVVAIEVRNPLDTVIFDDTLLTNSKSIGYTVLAYPAPGCGQDNLRLEEL